MAKIILICGKICCGKTYYARQLQEGTGSVILSMDEATFDLIQNEQGEYYDAFVRRLGGYLRKKACEICKAGANVILEWGFWSKQDRAAMSGYLTANGVPFEWHYLDIADDLWQQRIEMRNKQVATENGGADFYVDAGLLEKLCAMFEAPDKEEIDVWQSVGR